MEIINSSVLMSAPFVIGKGEQYTLFATGLSGTDQVVIEILTVSTSSPFAGDPCCPGQVNLPEVTGAVPLKCRNGVAVRMTADFPWVVLEAPQGVSLRARVIAHIDAIVTVSMTESTGESCMGCPCEEPPPVYCASVAMTGGGFMFHAADSRDPAATTLIQDCSNVTLGYLYPTAGPGHTVDVRACDGTLIGYAVNRSDCAPECSLCDVAAAADGCDSCGCSGTSGGTGGTTTTPTVLLETCDGVALGHIYSASTSTATLALTDCNNSVIGYVNP